MEISQPDLKKEVRGIEIPQRDKVGRDTTLKPLAVTLKLVYKNEHKKYWTRNGGYWQAFIH